MVIRQVTLGRLELLGVLRRGPAEDLVGARLVGGPLHGLEREVRVRPEVVDEPGHGRAEEEAELRRREPGLLGLAHELDHVAAVTGGDQHVGILSPARPRSAMTCRGPVGYFAW